ncbi:hypothetical protein quinque_005552 [Culex quinquefasciatus]
MSANCGNAQTNAINIQHAAPVIPSGPVAVSPLQSVPGQQLNTISSNRPVNSTRNTGPPTNARSQRNHSGNGNYGGPRGSSGSNSRGQSTLNA